MPDIITKTVGTVARQYPSLTAWESAMNGDITAGGTDEIHVAECYNDSVLEDNLTIDGWTTDTDHYIKITTPTAQRHHGMPYTGFRIYHGALPGIIVRDGNVWVEGISFFGDGTPDGFYVNPTANTGWVKISKCFFRNVDKAIYWVPSIAVTGYFWNNIFVESYVGIRHSSGTEDAFAYNCSAYRCDYGFRVTASGPFTVKNCAALDSLTSDFHEAADFHADSKNNASTAASGDADKAPGTACLYEKSAEDNYSSLDYGVEDLHLISASVDLYNAGVDLSGDSDWPISDDIDSHARSQWDIGADEYTTSPPSGPVDAETSISTVGASGRDYPSLTAWEAAKEANLTIANDYAGGSEIAECYNDAVLEDNVTIDGWVTDTHCYIKVTTPTSERHTGIPGTGFRIDGGDSIPLATWDGNVHFEGISVLTTSVGINCNISGDNPGWCKVSHCLIYYYTENGDGINYIVSTLLSETLKGYIWNNFVIGAEYGIAVTHSDTTKPVYIYNNSIYNCISGIYAKYANVTTVKNNVVIDCSVYDFALTANFHADSCNNASSAGSGDTDKAPGANSLYSITAADNFTDITPGSEDLHITNSAADIYDTGINLSADSYLVVTDDIDGETRVLWDIGADSAPYIASNPNVHGTFLDLGITLDSATTLEYSNVNGNPEAISFLARIYPQFDSTTIVGNDKYIFNYYASADDTDYVRMYWDVSDSDWVFVWHPSAGTTLTLRTQLTQVFNTNEKYIELFGWVDRNGVDIDDTTYYGKLYVNGREADSYSGSQPAALVNQPNTLSLSDATNPPDCTYNELALMYEPLVDYYAEKFFAQREPSYNYNAYFKASITLASGDVLIYNAQNGEVEFYDASLTTVLNGNSFCSGRSLTLMGGDREEAVLYIPNAINNLAVIYRPHWA